MRPVCGSSGKCESYPLWGASSATALLWSKGGGPFREHIFSLYPLLSRSLSSALWVSRRGTVDVFLLTRVKLYSGDGSPIFCLLGRPHPQTTPSLHSRLWVLPITFNDSSSIPTPAFRKVLLLRQTGSQESAAPILHTRTNQPKTFNYRTAAAKARTLFLKMTMQMTTLLRTLLTTS